MDETRRDETHGIGIVAEKVADPGPEPYAFSDHFETVDCEEKKEGNGYAHETVGRARAFELVNEEFDAFDCAGLK